MKYFDEMKYEEMSDILGTSVGALKASYHHAVKKIEKFFIEQRLNFHLFTMSMFKHSERSKRYENKDKVGRHR